MKYLRQIYHISLRECRILVKNPIYGFCMVLFPIFVTILFTTMLGSGQPSDMPVGVVDLDNTTTTRQLLRTLDAFQNTDLVRSYPNVNEARRAIQRNEIYAFVYVPRGTTSQLLASRRPKISFYYSLTSVTSGTLLYKDLKTISTLGSAALIRAKMRAQGYRDNEILTFIQPIRLDAHQVHNPETDYNVYLSTMLVPGVLMMFIFLITAYSLGSELKFNTSKRLMQMADGNIWVAMTGKLLPQTLIFLTIFYAFEFYAFGLLQFPHYGTTFSILLMGALGVLASQGFGVFAFGLAPSLRMSMSICSLWAVLSFSMVGSAFPVSAMDPMLQSLSWLFPLRYYFMYYQISVFNGYPFVDAAIYVLGLIAFAVLPIALWPKIKNVMLHYEYIP